MDNLITSPSLLKGYPVIGLTPETCIGAEKSRYDINIDYLKSIAVTKEMADDIVDRISSINTENAKMFVLDSLGGNLS